MWSERHLINVTRGTRPPSRGCRGCSEPGTRHKDKAETTSRRVQERSGAKRHQSRTSCSHFCHLSARPARSRLSLSTEWPAGRGAPQFWLCVPFIVPVAVGGTVTARCDASRETQPVGQWHHEARGVSLPPAGRLNLRSWGAHATTHVVTVIFGVPCSAGLPDQRVGSGHMGVQHVGVGGMKSRVVGECPGESPPRFGGSGNKPSRERCLVSGGWGDRKWGAEGRGGQGM